MHFWSYSKTCLYWHTLGPVDNVDYDRLSDKSSYQNCKNHFAYICIYSQVYISIHESVHVYSIKESIFKKLSSVVCLFLVFFSNLHLSVHISKRQNTKQLFYWNFNYSSNSIKLCRPFWILVAMLNKRHYMLYFNGNNLYRIINIFLRTY